MLVVCWRTPCSLFQDPGKSDKVCRPCTRKIRNAADCFTFITGKLTENDAEPKEQEMTEKIVADNSNTSASILLIQLNLKGLCHGCQQVFEQPKFIFVSKETKK